jgi:hypothetical protein
MRDVVIVPCYERPEYTRLCLEYLSRARGIENKEIWIFLDNHRETDFRKIFDAQQPNLKYASFVNCQLPHDTYGNSKNLLDGLKAAYDSGAQRIFLVEDDIIVAPDIFEWHEEILDTVDPFVSCATALNKSAHFQINGQFAMRESCKNPDAYLEAIGPYSSHAAAFKRKNLGRLVEYLIETAKLLSWASGDEQDIRTQQYLRQIKKTSAWPYVPRAYNVGVYSYHINTGRKLSGTLEEKAQALDQIIHDPEKLREISANNSAVTAIPSQWPVRTEPVKIIR